MDEKALLANQRRLFISPAKRDAIGGSLDFKFTPGRQVEPLPKGLRHDQPARAVNGNDHAEMVLHVSGNINRSACTNRAASNLAQGLPAELEWRTPVTSSRLNSNSATARALATCRSMRNGSVSKPRMKRKGMKGKGMNGKAFIGAMALRGAARFALCPWSMGMLRVALAKAVRMRRVPASRVLLWRSFSFSSAAFPKAASMG